MIRELVINMLCCFERFPCPASAAEVVPSPPVRGLSNRPQTRMLPTRIAFRQHTVRHCTVPLLGIRQHNKNTQPVTLNSKQKTWLPSPIPLPQSVSASSLFAEFTVIKPEDPIAAEQGESRIRNLEKKGNTVLCCLFVLGDRQHKSELCAGA